MYLDEIEQQTIRKWMGFFKNSPGLCREVVDETPTLISGNSYTLKNYNAIQSTISLSDGIKLSSYLPYDNNGKQTSVIIVEGGNLPFTVSYKYNPVALLTRTRKKIDNPSYETPRLFVLWGNSVKMPNSRQVNDAGRLTTRRRVYLSMVVDVDENQGGYPLKSEITSSVLAAIENGRDELYVLGFEDISVEEVPPNEKFDQEKPLERSRGVIMVACTVYVELQR